MSSQAADLQAIAEKAFGHPFGGVVRMECDGDRSSLWIDGRQDKPAVSEAAPPEVSAQFCLWRSDFQTLHLVLAGQRPLEAAYIAGQLKISGDMSVMARLELLAGP